MLNFDSLDDLYCEYDKLRQLQRKCYDHDIQLRMRYLLKHIRFLELQREEDKLRGWDNDLELD